MCGLSKIQVTGFDRLSGPECRLSAARTAREPTLYSQPHEKHKANRLHTLRAVDHNAHRWRRFGDWHT